LREFPDFADLTRDAAAADALPGRRSLPPPLPPSPAMSDRRIPTSPVPVARWSSLAIASLVLSVFGFLVFPGLLGLVCGLLALSRIRKSGGALKGRALASIGIMLSLVMLVLVTIFVFWVIQQNGGRRPPRPMMTATGCGENLAQLANSVRHYANDHADILPGATNWCDQVREYVPNMEVYTCPGGNFGRKSSFALNLQVAGRNQESVNPATVLLFESGAGWNASGTKDIAGSAGGVLHVVLFDGQVVRVGRDGLAGLRWDP